MSEECVEDVQSLVALTDDLGKDLRLKANDIKSRRFTTCKVAEGALRGLAGPPVGNWFKDLGVLQSMGCHAPAEPRKARHQEVRARLARISRLAVPFPKRVWIAAASAVPAATYGMAAHPTPVNDLRYLRSSVKSACLKGAAWASINAFFHCLDLPWRLDPGALALIGPWEAIRVGIVGRTLSWESLNWLWQVSGDWDAGPVSAAKQGLHRAKVAGDWSEWRDQDAIHLERPLEQATTRWKGFLLDAYTTAGLRELAKSRPSYEGVEVGVDHWAMRTVIRKTELSWAQQGALRSVQVGNVVTQDMASKWKPDQVTCRYCGQHGEDAWHRFWHCPRWEPQRREALGLRSQEAALRTVAACTARHGIIPQDPELVQARREAQGAPEWTMEVVPGILRVYTDGSGLHPKDPYLRRAGWGLAYQAGGFSRWQWHGGAVPGRQSVARAELYAALWARTHFPGAQVVTDCLYVQHGCTALRTGKGSKSFFQGPDGDLWKRMAALEPPEVRWVRSHLSLEEARNLGFEQDWEGNSQADLAAKQAAQSRAPAQHLVDKQQRRMDLFEGVIGVVARVQEAVLNHERRHGHDIAKERKPKRQLPMPVDAPQGDSPAKRPCQKLPPHEALVRPQGPPPQGVHWLMPEQGPVTEAQSRALNTKGKIVSGWNLHCLRCGDYAVGCNVWREFARSFCPAEGGEAADHRWAPCNHEVEVRPWGGQCLRCGLMMRHRRVAVASESRCMTWGFYSQGVEVPEARPWGAWYTALPSTWKLDRGGECAPHWNVSEQGAPGVDEEAPPTGNEPEGQQGGSPIVKRLRTGYRPHALVAGAGLVVCLRCCWVGSRRGVRAGQNEVCDGDWGVSPLITAYLLEGAFDGALSDAGPELRRLATARGWLGGMRPGRPPD